MTWFSADNHSRAVVSADRAAVWAVLTDPDALAQMTPMLDHIVTDGDLWRWEMNRIPVLGVSVAPSFTERMRFVDGERIDYDHAPPEGTRERAAAKGTYLLTDEEGGTGLTIDLKLSVDLPLPRAMAPAVERTMRRVVEQMGERFAANLLRHLDAVAVA